VHFTHRVLGILVGLVVLSFAVWAVRAAVPAAVRTWALLAAGLVVGQITLGFLSVLTVLAVVPVSAHTLVAAALLVVLVHLAVFGTVARDAAEVPSQMQAT